MISIAITVGLLVWALRGVHTGDVLKQIRHADPYPLFAAVVLATALFPIRLVRWRLLLRAADGSAFPATPLWHAIAIGFMANNVLPFRAGELARAYTASRLTGARFSAVLSSLVVERVLDGLVIVLLLAAGLLLPGLPHGLSMGVGFAPVARWATWAGLAFGTLLVAGIALVAFPRAGARLLRAVVPFPRLAERLVGTLEGVTQGLSALRSPVRLVAAIGWSLTLWGVSALSFYVAYRAFDLHVNLGGALLMQGILMLGISLPSSPSGLGPFEAAISFALAFYGVAADRAFAYAITYHLTTFVPIVVLGLWSLWRTNLRLAELRAGAAP